MDITHRRSAIPAEKEVEKEKGKGKPVLGSLVLDKPIVRVAGERPKVVIPQIMLNSILHKLYPPLHWFSDERLDFIQHRSHELDTKVHKPEATAQNSNPDKIVVFDMAKMTKRDEWGTDEHHSCLTPLAWQETISNLEAALVLLSESPSESKQASRYNYAEQMGLHRLFFVKYGRFEQNYARWYDFERRARHEILQGVIFDRNYYVAEVDGLLRAAEAAHYPGSRLLALGASTLGKRGSDSDLRGSPKAAKTIASDSPSGWDASVSHEARTPTVCVCCAGPHTLNHHPSGATTFTDGKPCFSHVQNGVLFVMRSLNTPAPQKVCVSFNLAGGCHHQHDGALLHICSFCGKTHGALSRATGVCPRLTSVTS